MDELLAFILVSLLVIILVYVKKLRKEVDIRTTFLIQEINIMRKQLKELATTDTIIKKTEEPVIQPEEKPVQEIHIPERVIPEEKPLLIPEEVILPAPPEPIIPEPAIQEPIIQEPTPIFIKQPEEKKENILFKQLKGENLLSKIGIITLVLGIAFFVKYAIDQDWINEIGRVGIGLLTGVAIIATSYKLKKQYDVFSSILAGGGFAVFYITITLAFREYELLPQPVAFAMLILTTVACVILSLFYDRKELALFALLGGFTAPFMISRGEGNYIVLFSYILILNSGMLWLVLKKNWEIIGKVTFGLTQLLVWGWLLGNFHNQYIGAFLFILLFFIQFHALVLADHLFRKNKMTITQMVLIICNNVSLFAGGLYIFSSYPAELNGLITIIPAILNAAALLSVFRNRRTDENITWLLIASILTFITIAIPIQLKGNVITIFWSAEVVILLFLWLRSNKPLFRIGMYIVLSLSILSYLMDITASYDLPGLRLRMLPIMINKYFITGLTVLLAFYACYYLLKKKISAEENTNIPSDNRQKWKTMYKFFGISIFVMAYIIPFNEINFQLQFRLPEVVGTGFEANALSIFTTLYAAFILFLKRKAFRENYKTYYLIPIVFLALYTFIYMYGFLQGDRDSIYLLHYLTPAAFSLHLITLPAIYYMFYETVRICLQRKEKEHNWQLWVLTILAVMICTAETDNLVILIAGNQNNYEALLHATHTFGYPILWGLLAMGLMIAGLKLKDIRLRKISLFFFAFIICKFYLYDVWRMSQGGRIISFVILGLILLLVSFMQQKIKKLMKEE